jgi:hypothetical protein
VWKNGKYEGIPMSWTSKYTSAEEVSQLCNSSKVTGVVADLLGMSERMKKEMKSFRFSLFTFIFLLFLIYCDFVGSGCTVSCLGMHKVPTMFGAQIALVFPDDVESAIPLEKMGYHIDGEPNHKNEREFASEQPKLNSMF